MAGVPLLIKLKFDLSVTGKLEAVFPDSSREDRSSEESKGVRSFEPVRL